MFDLHLQDFQRNPSVLLRLQPGEGPQSNRPRPRSLRVAAKKKYKISECGLEGRCLQRRDRQAAPLQKSRTRTRTSSRTITERRLKRGANPPNGSSIEGL